MALGFNMEGEEGLLGSNGLVKLSAEMGVGEHAMALFSLVFWLE